MVAALGLAALAAAAGPVVTVPGVGKLSGATALGVDSFLGIPYAAPPVRWQPPEAAAPWRGTRDATAFGSTCMGSKVCGNVTDSEDCLFLNVFRPTRRPNRPLPVMVFIHGGSYTTGCSNNYLGWTMLNQSGHSVVLVTINYRLGEFGFLGGQEIQKQTGDGSSGNFGFQDQRQALRWVQDHIAPFRGDPNRVTIFGESAGAGSVAAHLVSAQSWPLFWQAIMESGAGSVWNSKPLSAAQEAFSALARQTRCAASASPVRCLRALSARELHAAAGQIPDAGTDAGRYIQWAPVVDGVELGADVGELFEQGHFKRSATTVLGTNRDEAAFFALGGYLNMSSSATEADFDRLLGPWFGSKAAAALPELKELYSAAKYNYPSDMGPYSHWWWAVVRAQTDRDFTCPHRRTARAMVAQGSSPLFSYYLVHPSQAAVPGIPGCGPGSIVVPHASELLYVFACANISVGTPKLDDWSSCRFQAAGEADLASEMAGAWARFAANGHPGAVSGVRWPALPDSVPSDRAHLVFDVSTAAGGKGVGLGGPGADLQCDFFDRFMH
eukprot:TRINITY_DN798_c0_g2_i2.p1 TRINITY_DN798_c0_g2~~TRINITY_DN798_c0_g2_i2.p1  ORF type:complete len:580 (+),score=164.77 TRINITY_DN798_c0_g2_i2:81-1742(+)